MSLPLPWVDKIFAKLTLVYGRDFMGRWEGLEIADVKTDWCHELSGFEHWPEAIAHALSHLPAGRPPTALEFRDLARKAPPKELPALPAPVASPERVKGELAKLDEAHGARRMRCSRIDSKAWARRLIEREQSGEILGYTISRMAHAALRSERGAAGEVR